MKTPCGWHVIQPWECREGDSEKVLSQLRLKGQVENRCFNHVKFTEEKRKSRGEVVGGGTAQRHRQRREHGTSWATVSSSRGWDVEDLYVSRSLPRKGLGNRLLRVNFILRIIGNFRRKKPLNRMSERIALPFKSLPFKPQRDLN